MKKEYIPVLVEKNRKQELWQIDVTNLSITELVKLKEALMNMPYDKTIQSLDRLIRQNVETQIPKHSISDIGYVRKYKKIKRKKNKN